MHALHLAVVSPGSTRLQHSQKRFRSMSYRTVDDVRGLGLFAGVELVKNNATKERFGWEARFIKRLNDELLARGLVTRMGRR